jgi:hypothetical protein
LRQFWFGDIASSSLFQLFQLLWRWRGLRTRCRNKSATD